MSQPSAFLVGRSCMIPALLSSPAIGSPSSMICAAAFRALAGSDRSQTTGTARPPSRAIVCRTESSRSGERPTSTTVPCLARSSAVCRPMPAVGPVTMYAC